MSNDNEIFFENYVDFKDKDYEDLLAEAKSHFEHFNGKFTSGSSFGNIEHYANPRDWEDFDLYIDLSHKIIIPPHHFFKIEYSLEDHEKICLRYEYYFKYKIELILTKQESIEFVYPYLLSIIFTDYYYEQQEKKRDKLMKIPIFGGFLSRRRSDEDLSVDTSHQQLKNKLEDYINEKLDHIDIANKKDCYEKFFQGIPEDSRGFKVNL